MGVLAETFGVGGLGAQFFGGQWWLLGLFLLLIFVIFLSAYRVSAEAISVVITLGLLIISSYNIFIIGEQITQTILFIIFMFVAFIFYKVMNK